MFSVLGDLPSKLSNELRRRFAKIIDPTSSNFSPLYSAATLIHPDFFSLLPEELVIAGKAEIGRWISRLPTDELSPLTTKPVSSRFSRLAAQQTLIAKPNVSWEG